MESLRTIKQMIQDEKQKEDIRYGDICYLSRDIIAFLLGERSEWYSQMNIRTFSKL